MVKTALLFAGQGAQFVGMGKDLAQHSSSARSLFDQASAALGFDLAQTAFEGPEPELTKTENAQPAIYLVSWIALRLLLEARPSLRIDATAGLSLGEFTALAAAGALDFLDGLRLVRLRGRAMQDACDTAPGAMAAIIGLDEPLTREVCSLAGVELANLNCPGQLVISGPTEGIHRACQLAKERGAKRALPLPVAGAYHSRLMASAQPHLENALARVELRPPAVPVISNVTAQPHTDPDAIRRRLVEQITSPVQWENSIRYLLAQGFNRFIELGPGTALTGFMRRIDKSAIVCNIADPPSLQHALATLGD